MKIVLVNPPQTLWGRTFSVPAPVVPSGLAYIAAYLRKQGHGDITIIDSQDGAITSVENGKRLGPAYDTLADDVLACSPGIVGISCMFTPYYIDALFLAAEIKRRSPHTPIIVGGPHVSTFPHEIMRHPAVDVAVRGEGEKPFTALVEHIASGRSFEDIPNILWRRGGDVVENPRAALTEDLDEYPLPAYDLLPMERYIARAKSPYTQGQPFFGIVTSRGCTMQCVYCTVASLYGRGWRHHSAAHVAEEIELLVSRYGVREIHFLDDSIGAKREHIAGICNEIISRKIDISWTTPNGIAHWSLTKDLLLLMKRAGCYRITFGIESGAPEMRRFVGKPADLEQARSIIRYANRIGMWTACTFILGFPFETKEQWIQTIKFSIRCDTDMAVFYTLSYYPRTAVYEIARREGLIDMETLLDPMTAGSWIALAEAISLSRRTKDHSAEEINAMAAFGFRYFLLRRIVSFLNPLRLLRKMTGKRSLRYTIKLLSQGLIVIARFIRQRGRSSSYIFHVDERKKKVTPAGV